MKKTDVVDMTIRQSNPSLIAPPGRAMSSSALDQPAGESPKEDSLHDGAGSKVSFPEAADCKSAGPVGSGQGLAGSTITGAKVSFPATADTSLKGKDVTSFGC